MHITLQYYGLMMPNVYITHTGTLQHVCVCVFIQVMHPYIGHHRPLRLDENKVKEQTVSITKLDVALNNAIVRAKILG